MTRARPPAVIVQMPQTCGSLACIERATDYTRNCYRSAEDQRKQRQQRERRRRARARQKFAFAVALLIVAGLLAAFMPWSGTTAELPADVPPDIEKANSTAGLTAGQAFVAIPKQDEPATYTPPAAEVEALAKMLYGEARGIPSDTEKAACVWCVLNRVDDPRFPDTVLEVLEAPYQFAEYPANYPVTEELKRLAADVLTRYHAEKSGEENVGRVLPAEYCFFTGDGKHNYFTIGWQDTDTWGWTLESPYAD